MSGARKLEAVLFDMDGVIIDSEPLWSEAEKQLLARRKLGYSPELKEVLMGRGSRESVGHLIEFYNLSESVDDVIAERNQLIAKLFREFLQPIPPALDLIRSLRDAGIKTALASSSPKHLIELVMDKLRIAHLFDLILSGEQVVRGKPAPDIYLRAARELGVVPNHCVVVEDAPSGVAAAKSAGMRCLAISTSVGESALAAADWVVGGLAGIDLLMLHELLRV
jgi:HAD superfamily hydrolase (TIGR01509 family)